VGPLSGERREMERIHGDKIGMILTSLHNRGLIKPETETESDGASFWYLVEENTARLYMAMLAQYMADLDTGH
jgi:chromosome segregation and condensation protein ScpB